MSRGVHKQVQDTLACLLPLAGAAIAIFLSGKAEEAANIPAVCGAGLGLLLLAPRAGVPWLPVTVAVTFCALSALAFAPAGTFGEVAWREALPDPLQSLLGDTVCPQPWLAFFWWALLAGTTAFAICLLTVVVERRQLAVFLHAVALVIAIYAVLCVVDFQTAWKYPLSGNAPFGFLPNKNHTATLLFVGAIVSFGLMQAEIARGRKAGAVLAALCGAPPLAALLFFSNSRAGVVFLAIGLLIWAAGARRSGSGKVIFAGAGILAGFLAVLFLAGGSEVRDRLSVLLNEAITVRGEATEGPKDLDFRLPIFRDTFGMIADQPWSGAGLGQFKYVFPQYRDESSRAAAILHPESDWLMVAAESGVPAAAMLLVLVAWYALRSWRGRHGDEGLLRWTAASAVLAAVLHGMVDVPWHRVSLGWFLLVVALVCVPRNTAPLKHPVLVRIPAVLLGLAFLASAYLMARELSQGRPPLPYRWKEYNLALTKLGREMAWEEGEAKIGEAIAIYPLEKDAHHWMLAFTEATGPELEGIIRSGRAVEPVLPQVAEGQASLWRRIDASREAEAWADAVARSSRTDAREPTGGSASTRGVIARALQSLQTNAPAQVEFVGLLGSAPDFEAEWFRGASPEAVELWIGDGRDISGWLDGLQPEERTMVLDRWITLPSGAAAVAYMEARNGPAPGAYWRQLAGYHAKAGDRERAVGIVAGAQGLRLDGSVPDGAFARELAALRAQGNEVAVRRLVREAVEAREADAERLRVAVATYAAAGDWEMAWRAASRLVTAAKNRH